MKAISEWKLPQENPLKLAQQPSGRLNRQKSRRGVFEGDESTGGWPGGNSVAAGGVRGNRSDPPARARPVHTPTPSTAARAARAARLRGMVLSISVLPTATAGITVVFSERCLPGIATLCIDQCEEA